MCAKKSKILFLSQVYIPDPASVGQHMADAAEAMFHEGWDVKVITANKGYDNPSEKFRSRETLNGVRVHRVPFSSLGKKTIFHRLIGQLSFCIQGMFHALLTPGVDCIFVTTSPPMGSITGWVAGIFRRKVQIKFWVMDINPDQAIALGKADANGLPAKALNLLNKCILGRASDIIVLDRFMASTMKKKNPASRGKYTVMPPWPMEGYLERIEHQDNPFRKEHNFGGKFVVIYSGNHSIAHPLDTILEAARLMKENQRVVFVFIGGGLGKKQIDEFVEKENPRNVLSLPYQPLEKIKYSLSAADIHIVSMGEEMVGTVHPCKFYGAMALAKPVLLIGPRPCHASEIIEAHDCGWIIQHGDVKGVVGLLNDLSGRPQSEMERTGKRGLEAVKNTYSKDILSEKLVKVLSGKVI